MLDRAAILARIDTIMAALDELRAEVAAQMPAACDTTGHDEDDLLDTTSAAARFGYPRDTIAKWCREGLGQKQGGRWLVSISHLRQRLNGK